MKLVERDSHSQRTETRGREKLSVKVFGKRGFTKEWKGKNRLEGGRHQCGGAMKGPYGCSKILRTTTRVSGIGETRSVSMWNDETIT